ncbi:hypothetical protein AXF42_Ash012669 [Apostasia shenzhenica]|uniref:MHD1 domain-containing protein n=1 Tax=Apostasia shenzhenica TaxID=1088818 RepID=A0A2H9ZTC1_9ASPA|nr:hypothetical protein AXF42_Ash012669 [Apostasia shenzhenica]
MESSLLLQRYRSDRRKLLEFIFSSGVVQGPLGAPPELSGVDLDTVSTEYVLECVKSGGAFVSKEASERYSSELDSPVLVSVPSGNLFYLLSELDLSGSPPERAPPPVGAKEATNHFSYLPKEIDHFASKRIKMSLFESKISSSAPTSSPSPPTNDVNRFSLGLPSLRTGLSDDDMRETAYEVLLASIVHSGGPRPSFEEKKKERKSKFLKGLRPRRDGLHSQQDESHSDLMDTLRAQMEISEAMDSLIKKGLRNFSLGSMPDRVDVPRISLVLLGNLSRSDFPSERFYAQWHRRQADILEELLFDPANSVANGQQMLLFLLSKLRNIEQWVNLSHDMRTEVLNGIEKFISRMSLIPEKFGFLDEHYYLSDSYHFSVKLYEKLLCSVFDILEDGHLVEEAEEILGVLRMTWSMLGINQAMHDALYGWEVFQQFVRTGKLLLLKYSVGEVQKIRSNKDANGEVECSKNTICTVEAYGSVRDLNLVDAILFNINAWCSSQLEDYHLHFSQEDCHIFESILTLAVLSGARFVDEFAETKNPESTNETEVAFKLVHLLVERSVQAACKRVLDVVDAKSKMEQKHPLALLAKELKLLSEQEHTFYTPILCRQYAKAGIVFSVLVHRYYGEQLKPFLEGISGLSESYIPVLSAAYCLERYLAYIIHSTSGDSMPPNITNYVQPYEIRHFSAPLILHLVNVRHENILRWTERAILIENWEPLSSQRKQATSIIEVFRIIHESIDQFFDITLPMDTIHLRSLIIGIVRSLEAYLLHMINQQVDKSLLYPSPPALTRYKESAYPFMKKKLVESATLDEKVINQMDNLTESKLCVKLNTLHYIREQLDELEASIVQSWMARTEEYQTHGTSEEETTSSTKSVDELFSLFDDIRASAIRASDAILDFIGTRAIFWDMRETFLSSVYKGGVQSARLDAFLPKLDGVLDRVCDLIIDALRDQVVLCIYRATMAAYTWVLLDGGPSRAFSATDVGIMLEDVNMLKDLFIANGEGIPPDVVQNEAREAEDILELYSLKAKTIIDNLINASIHISHENDRKKPGSRSAKDADTLLRVLCHMKDESASEFLRDRYQLPKSSDYEETWGNEKETTSKSPVLSDILSNTSRWTETGQISFRIMKKKIQEAASEIKPAPWS